MAIQLQQTKLDEARQRTAASMYATESTRLAEELQEAKKQVERHKREWKTVNAEVQMLASNLQVLLTSGAVPSGLLSLSAPTPPATSPLAGATHPLAASTGATPRQEVTPTPAHQGRVTPESVRTVGVHLLLTLFL